VKASIRLGAKGEVSAVVGSTLPVPKAARLQKMSV